MSVSEGYITAVSWDSTSMLSVTWLNREQNVSTVITCKTESVDCTTVSHPNGFRTISSLVCQALLHFRNRKMKVGEVGHFSEDGTEMIRLELVLVRWYLFCLTQSSPLLFQPHSSSAELVYQDVSVRGGYQASMGGQGHQVRL